MKDNICQIVCSKTDGSCPSSSCAEQVGLGSDAVVDSYDTLTPTKCSELCEASKKSTTPEVDDSQRCRFWRYDSGTFSRTAEEKHCTLLKSCDTFEYCPEGTCQCGDVGCNGEGEEGEPADEKTCEPKTEFHPSADFPKTTYIRWGCSPSNPYSDDPVTANTFCRTTHKCYKWSPITDDLQVTCDGDTGKWKPDGEVPAGMEDFYAQALGGADPNYDGSVALKELECEPDPTKHFLTVNVEGTGGLLRCEVPDPSGTPTDYTINAPNTCILLCDFHLGMTIEGALSKEGDYVFTKIETGETITQEDVANQIKCW